MSKEYDEYERLAQTGALPADFDQLELANKNGWTVAHTAALHGHLPVEFNMWDMSNNGGWTVAHAAVTAGIGLLPEDFNQWGLANNEGLTVLRHFLLNNCSEQHEAMWEKERPLCRTDADWEVFKKELPEIYQKYAISDHMLDADNDQEALQGALQGALL
jgi:hypothetical protein